MSLNARAPDGRLFNPDRDVAHAFPNMVREVAGRLEDGTWPVVTAYLEQEGITMDQLGAACAAFCTFVASAADDPNEKMGDALHRSGWWDVPEQAQMAYMAMLGTVISGYFFSGVREVTLDGVGPLNTAQDIVEKGRAASKLLTMSRFQRFRSRLWRRIRGIGRAALGRSD